VRVAFARLTSLLARIQAQPSGTLVEPSSFAHCRILHELGLCLQNTRQPIDAEARFREALAVLERLLEQAPDDHDLLHEHASLFGDLGSVLRDQGKYTQAREASEQALKEQRALL
jgi:tetratricopeptide (TPR) repeat protein